MSVFILEGANINDVTALKSDPVLSTMRTIDDSKTGTLSLWTSEQIMNAIRLSVRLTLAGTFGFQDVLQEDGELARRIIL